ncbi:MAG: hypothetical protein PHE93_06125 [Clostridia bacterium]|nr:hypothetical protein [Clostridia bacterium]
MTINITFFIALTYVWERAERICEALVPALLLLPFPALAQTKLRYTQIFDFA